MGWRNPTKHAAKQERLTGLAVVVTGGLSSRGDVSEIIHTISHHPALKPTFDELNPRTLMFTFRAQLSLEEQMQAVQEIRTLLSRFDNHRDLQLSTH